MGGLFLFLPRLSSLLSIIIEPFHEKTCLCHMGTTKGRSACTSMQSDQHLFSSPEQSSQRAIVLPPASVLALASASTNAKVLC